MHTIIRIKGKNTVEILKALTGLETVVVGQNTRKQVKKKDTMVTNKACKETKYLTVDLMNWYINSHNVKCPKRDGGELKGGLGKYGPYVRCNCEHFLKPDEI